MMRTVLRVIRRLLKYAVWILLGLIVGAAIYSWSLYWSIRDLAIKDDAHVADTIVILGAAQYKGKPSPVLKARLDHALDLYNRGYAGTIITTGGYGPDPNFSEAQVSTEYLKQQGIDANSIITEQGSSTTRDSVRAAVEMMQSKGWTRALTVSDGFHMYRVRRMFEDAGVVAYTSPAPDSPIESSVAERYSHSLREILLYTVYRVLNL